MTSRSCAVCCIAVALVASAWTIDAGDKPAAVPEVPVVRAVVREVTDHEDFTGRTDAVMRVDLRARVTGYLTAAQFKEGDLVKQGDVLFEIDPRPYQARLDQALSQVALYKASLRLAQTTLTRELALAKAAPGSISPQQLAQDEAAVAEASARVRAAEAGVDVAKLNVAFCKVTAPFSGRIGRRTIDPGNLVNADQTSLAALVSEEPMYVYFRMDEHTYLLLRQALPAGKPAAGKLPVAIGLAREPGFPHRGVLDFINNEVDATTGTISLRATLPNKDHRLVPGLFVRVRLALGAPHKALLVPDGAVRSEEGLKYVYVVGPENKVQYRRVTAGALQPDGLRVISEGLKPDDRVISGALARIRPGMTVRPKEGEAPAPKPAAPPPEDLPLAQAQPGPGIRVETTYAGASAQVVANTVRAPIEQQVSGMENIRYMRSRCTSDGRYALDVVFAPGVDLWRAQVQVQGRVALALPQLPAEVGTGVVNVRCGSSGVLLIAALASPAGRFDRLYLGNYARININDELARIAGVAEVSLIGAAEFGMRIWLDTARLAARGLSAADVTRVLRNHKWGGAAATDDIADVIVKTGQDGSMVRLRDVARVEVGACGAASDALLDGRPAVAILVHLTGAKAPRTVRAAVEEKLRALRQRLPDDMVLDVAFDFTANLESPGKQTGADYLVLDLDLAAGREKQTDAVLTESGKRLRELHAVNHVLALSQNPFDAFGGRPCLLVRVNPPDAKQYDRAALLDAIRTELGRLKEAAVRIRDLSVPGSFPRCGYPIDLALSGPDAAEVRAWAKQLGDRLVRSEKLTDVWVNRDSLPRVTQHVAIDRAKAAALGVTVSEILSTVEVYGGAVPVGHVNRFGRSLRVEVQTADHGAWADGLGMLKVRSAGGAMVPLNNIVRVRQVEQPAALDFLDLRPMVEITANAAVGVSTDAAQMQCAMRADEMRRELGLSAEYRLRWLHALSRGK